MPKLTDSQLAALKARYPDCKGLHAGMDMAHAAPEAQPEVTRIAEKLADLIYGKNRDAQPKT